MISISKKIKFSSPHVIIWSIPLFWLIGGERLLAPTFYIIYGFYLLISKYKNPLARVPKSIFWFILFLMFYIISIIQVNESYRYITFFWDLNLYISFLIIMFVIYLYADTYYKVDDIIKHIILFACLVHAMGILYLIFSDTITFESILGKVLPSSIKSTTAGRIISIRSLGKDLYFFGLTKRLSSISSTSIHYGAFCLITFPFGFYYYFKSRGFLKILYLGFIVLSVMMCFFAQARAALIIMCLVIFIFTLIALNNKIKYLHPYTYFSIVFTYTVIFLLGFVFIFYKEIMQAMEIFFIINRASSFEHRQEIYSRTIQELLENPILGYGTQRSVEDMFYPIGSHNWYLSVLYKHGIFGFISFLLFYLGLIWLTFKLLGKAITLLRDRIMICYTFLILFVSHALLVLTIEPIVDAMHIFMFAIISGLTLSLGKLLLKEYRFLVSNYHR